MTKKTTKRALISSLLMLAICFTTLVGTTFAWFTDSASSTGNTIKTGKLDIELYTYDANNNLVDITNNTAEDDPIFGADILWEPNATQVRYFQVKNAGNLALKFNVALEVYGVTKNLHEVMQYAVIPGADPVNNPVNSWNGGTDIVVGKNPTSYADIELEENGDVASFAIAVHMDHNAGNQYQMAQILFDINVIAAQLNFEKDSFNSSDYDLYAAYPGFGRAPVDGGSTYIELDDENGANVGSVTVPEDAVADDATEITVKINRLKENTSNITVAAGEVAQPFDVQVTGLKEGNTSLVKVTLRMPTGIDPNTVKLYHYDQPVDTSKYSYDPTSGYVTFQSATFSPFTVVHKNEYNYVVPSVPEEEITNAPKATVTYAPEYVNAEIEWNDDLGIYPDYDLDPKLEAVFKFAVPEELDPAYASWSCDFFVSLDRDLGENEILLGGNYGDFGWIGFHNGDVTLKANEEIGLLSSVVTIDWTYEMIYELVGEFMCGVGDVNDALDGATFTVKLRLWNPDTDESIDVNVVTYTFGGSYTIK